MAARIQLSLHAEHLSRFSASPGLRPVPPAMVPAKEVGGDFYDFFLIDEDHLGNHHRGCFRQGSSRSHLHGRGPGRSLRGTSLLGTGPPASVLLYANTRS